jgi:hypothetical protein
VVQSAWCEGEDGQASRANGTQGLSRVSGDNPPTRLPAFSHVDPPASFWEARQYVKREDCSAVFCCERGCGMSTVIQFTSRDRRALPPPTPRALAMARKVQMLCLVRPIAADWVDDLLDRLLRQKKEGHQSASKDGDRHP